jgi:hypothetical protein
MQTITTIGLDIAKSVFQVHRVGGQVVIRRQLKAALSWRSSRSCRRVWSASRRAPRRIIGRGRSKRFAIPCDCCHRLT